MHRLSKCDGYAADRPPRVPPSCQRGYFAAAQPAPGVRLMFPDRNCPIPPGVRRTRGEVSRFLGALCASSKNDLVPARPV